MRKLCVLAAVLVVAMSAGVSAQAPQGDAAKRILGAWSYVGTWVDGVPRDRGNNPSGMIVYLPSGHMSVQVAPDHPRKRAGTEATPQEAKDALTGYVAYFGTYVIDERAGTVTHRRRASIQPGDSAD